MPKKKKGQKLHDQKHRSKGYLVEKKKKKLAIYISKKNSFMYEKLLQTKKKINHPIKKTEHKKGI